MSDFDAQRKRMLDLISYGKVEENTKKHSNCTLEFHETAADGRTYGIVRECNKFYIKTTTPEKGLVAENYQYIGGFNNKKDYEYSSYANALKNLELKLESVKRANDCEQDIEGLHLFEKEVPLMNESTDEMKKSLARYRQIMYNSSVIMNEEAIGKTPFTNQPEAAKGHSGDEDAPFTQAVTPDMDFDGGKSSSCPKCEGDPFVEGEKGKKAKDGERITVDGSVASMHPAGGKVVRVNESVDDDTFNAGLPSEAGIGDPMDYAEWVEGGRQIDEEDELELDDEDMDDEEFDLGAEEEEDEEPMEDEDFDFEEGEEELDDEDEIEDIEDEDLDDEDMDDEDMDDEELDDEEFELDDEEDEPMEDEDFDFEEDEEENDDEDMDDEDMLRENNGDYYVRMCEDLDIDFDSKLGRIILAGCDGLSEEDIHQLVSDYREDPDSDELDEYLDDEDAEEEMDECGMMNEAKKHYMNSIVESVVKTIKEEELHVFGKHPGYRKKPMDLPETGSDRTPWGEDWNDESVYSEEPFGLSIGDSKPFDKVVDAITSKVMESLKKK